MSTMLEIQGLTNGSASLPPWKMLAFPSAVAKFWAFWAKWFRQVHDHENGHRFPVAHIRNGAGLWQRRDARSDHRGAYRLPAGGRYHGITCWPV